MKVKSFLKGFAAVGMAVAAAGATPVFAENGVQTGTQTFTTNDAGKIKLTYDTTGGQWQDPGPDPTKTDDNNPHNNGTYLVTIPTAITYENMAIGTVNTSDDYTVNVRGAIGSGKQITLTAQTNQLLANGSRPDDIKETTTQGKTTWSADETFGNLNTDGSLSGTDSKDNIKMTGTAKAAGTYTGTVGYTATLGDAPRTE